MFIYKNEVFMINTSRKKLMIIVSKASLTIKRLTKFKQTHMAMIKTNVMLIQVVSEQ